MASLSNINGLFDVHSTGAILFSTSHGTSGQILRSNGNAAPTWVAASTVIGGPYLPLSGGTLTGATATASGISFSVGGALTGTSATFSGNVTGPRFIGTSDRTEAVDSNDTRNTNPDPEDIGKGVYFDFKTNSANGLSDGGSYNGMMLWRSYGGGSDLSGGQPIRLAYTANGNLWRQMGTGATSWGTWNKFAIGTGTTAQYIRGDASLATFPTIPPDPTGVYLPLTGGTVTGSTDFTAGTYPLDVYGIGSTAGSSAVGLGVYGSSSAGAIMHFHRPGAYAVNFGLDSDNILRIGGWSAAANRWTLDMSGNNTVAGSFTAAGVIYASGGNSNTWNSHTSNTGTVTSVATGNGLTGGTITSTGTLSLDRPNSQLGAVLATYGTTA
jgi:hypothetical protein